MLVHKVVLLSLLCGIINGKTYYLREIIDRIHKEFNSGTVCVIGFDRETLRDLLQKPFDVPLEILNTSPAPDENTRSPYGRILVVQVSRNFPNFHHFINQISVRKFVVIHGNSAAELHRYFSFFWEKYFTRIFGVTANNTYAYFPFDDNNRVREIASDTNPLPNSLKDFNGYAFRTILPTDPPRVVWYTDQEGHSHIGGTFGEIFLAFMKRHNATFININNLGTQLYSTKLNGTFAKQIDISLNIYGDFHGMFSSYPIELVSWKIMVPVNGYVDSSQFFLKPFQPKVWLCLGLVLVFLIVTDMLKDTLADDPVDFWNSFRRIFLIFINMPLHKPATNAYRFYIQVHILAFICVNFYLIIMTSFLTVYIKVKQYESIQDLIDNNVPVKFCEFEWKTYSHMAKYPDGFENIIVLQDRRAFYLELESMKNTNFAYAEGSDKLEFLLQSQLKPKFRIIRESLQNYYLEFIFQKNSPLREIFDDLIFDVLATGLRDKWRRNAFVQTVKEGLMSSELENVLVEETRPLALHHFKFAWICFVFGMTSAIGAFAVEILIFVFSRKSSAKNNKN